MRISVPTRGRRPIAGVATLLAGAVLLGAGPGAILTVPAPVNLGVAAPYAVHDGNGVAAGPPHRG